MLLCSQSGRLFRTRTQEAGMKVVPGLRGSPLLLFIRGSSDIVVPVPETLRL